MMQPGHCTLTEEEIEQEKDDECTKKTPELIKDLIREANTTPKQPDGEQENLDTIKHLIKRLAVHQRLVEHKAKWTNRFLFLLSIIAATGSIISLLSYL